MSGHKPKPSRADRESGKRRGTCLACGRPLREVFTGDFTDDEDGHNGVTYWRHMPEPASKGVTKK